MSTRGSIAWRENGEVKGVYNHYDSYIDGLGYDILSTCIRDGMANVVESLKKLGDWREYGTDQICPYCGQKGLGQPHSISLRITGQFDKNGDSFLEKNSEWPDPNCECHQHSGTVDSQFNPFNDPLFMEYVYVLVPEDNVIEIWEGDGKQSCFRENKILETAQWVDYGHCTYRHVKVYEMDLNEIDETLMREYILNIEDYIRTEIERGEE